MNLQGKVISVEGTTVTIMPKHEDLKVWCNYVLLMNMNILVMVTLFICQLCLY